MFYNHIWNDVLAWTYLLHLSYVASPLSLFGKVNMDILFALDDLRDNTDALVGDTAPFVFRGGHWSLDTDPVGELLFKKFIKVVIKEL